MAISRIFDISKRSLAVYQKAMDVAAHNVANAGNADYSRQRVGVTSDMPQSDRQFQWGSGIKLATLQRVQDDLISNQIFQNKQKYSNYNKQFESLSQVEVVFGEPTEFGLANYLNKFFDSFTSLSASPNSVEARKEVIFAAQNLSNKVKDIYGSISDVKTDLASTFTQKTKELNAKLNELKEVNLRIYEAGAQGISPNDLMDKRDRILKDLSEIAPIKTQIDENGVATVYVGGVFAVNMDSVTEFKAVKGSGDKLELRTVKGDIKAVLSGGEIAGITKTYNDELNDYIERLDTMMNAMVESVNSIHEKGYTIDSTPQTGIKFFDSYSRGKLQINSRIVNDTNKIAVSSDGSAGNAEYAVALADIKNQDIFGGLNIMQYYGNIVNDIGNAANSAKSLSESTDLVIQQLETQKDSITAVSIDEEMTNILKYQKSYNASAKLIQMANEVMDVLFSMV